MLKDYSKDSKFKFYLEMVIALAAIAISFAWAYYPLISAPNDCYPVTIDGMGHFTKIEYIANSLKEFSFYSWFPYWYEGAATIQYYPPLPYFILAIIYIITDNIMLTYKIYCILSICVGSVGVWILCRRFIGNWCGIFAAVVHTISTFLLAMLLYEGVLAQGVVYMLTPWLLYTVIRFLNKPTVNYFILNVILTALLILSHAMHAFIVCLCIALILLIYVFIKKIYINRYILLGVSMAFGGALTAFWAIPGATKLENPTIPYVLAEAVALWTAKPEWFYISNNPNTTAYFDLILTIVITFSLFFVIVYSSITKIRKSRNEINVVASFCIVLSAYTIIFSFGKFLPGFRYIPLSESLVPGRILSLTTVCASIVCGYLLHCLFSLSRKKSIPLKIASILLSLGLIIMIITPIRVIDNRFKYAKLDSAYKDVFEDFDIENSNFDKGRYTWVTPIDSAETYFPMLYEFNMADGYNIEGTPHNRSLWNYNIALSSEAGDYTAKNMLMWNVRFAKISERYVDLFESMKRLGFEVIPNEHTPGIIMLKHNQPSSYYLIDKRDALVLGEGAHGVAMEFPNIVKGWSNDITQYSLEELERYKLIYIAEPPIQTIYELTEFEKRVSELVDKKKTILIEPSNIMNFPIFGVSAFDFTLETDTLLKKNEVAPLGGVGQMNSKLRGTLRGLSGLDEVMYKLVKKNSNLENDIIGAKNVGEGSVYFLGMHLSQYLKSTSIQIYGMTPNTDTSKDFPYADSVKKIINSFLDIASIHKDFIPDFFPVKEHKWDNTGGQFTYTSDKDQEVVLSVTYAPRWKVMVDGNPIKIHNIENLILLNLPAGTHTVQVQYETTIYARIGKVISIVSLVFLIVFLLFYKKFYFFTNNIIHFTADKLELP